MYGTRWEWTAGVCSASTVGKDARYYDLYKVSDQTSAKVGDALGKDTYTTNPGCSGWHDAGNAGWFNYTDGGFRRGWGGIFSFQGNYVGGDRGSCRWTDVNCGRGVAVVQSGV